VDSPNYKKIVKSDIEAITIPSKIKIFTADFFLLIVLIILIVVLFLRWIK